MTIIVAHRSYGCETGCCGHVVEADGKEVGRFFFDHPNGVGDTPDFVRRLVTERCGEEHVKDIDWDRCIVVQE